jgi:hypothetical protein
VETIEQVAIAHLAGVVVVRAHDRQPDHSGRPAGWQCREIDTPATEDFSRSVQDADVRQPVVALVPPAFVAFQADFG